MELKEYPFLQIIPDPVLTNAQLVSEDISDLDLKRLLLVELGTRVNHGGRIWN